MEKCVVKVLESHFNFGNPEGQVGELPHYGTREHSYLSVCIMCMSICLLLQIKTEKGWEASQSR